MKKNYILSAFGICFLAILSLFSLYLYNALHLYEDFLPFIAIILAVILVLCTISYFSRKVTIYNMGTFIMLLCNIILIYNIIAINNLNGYVTNMITRKYEYTTYNLYVKKKTPIYSNIYKLETKNIGILVHNKNNVSTYVSKIIDSKIIMYEDIESLNKAIEENEIQGFLIPEKEYNSHDFTSKEQLKTIYHGKIKEAIST